jgi:hypothetical protein
MSLQEAATWIKKDHAKNCFAWLQQVATDKGMKPICSQVALVLSNHFNATMSGICWPSIGRLANAIGASERTVQTALKTLKDRRHITITYGGTGPKSTNHYTPQLWVKDIAPLGTTGIESGEDEGAEENGENAPLAQSRCADSAVIAHSTPNGTPIDPISPPITPLRVKNRVAKGEKSRDLRVKDLSPEHTYEHSSKHLCATGRIEQKPQSQEVQARTLAECMSIAGVSALEMEQPRRTLREVQKLVARDVATSLYAGQASFADKNIRIEACHLIREQEIKREQMALQHTPMENTASRQAQGNPLVRVLPERDREACQVR